MRRLVFVAAFCVAFFLVHNTCVGQQSSEGPSMLLAAVFAPQPPYSARGTNSVIDTLFDPVPIATLSTNTGTTTCAAPAEANNFPTAPNPTLETVSADGTVAGSPRPSIPAAKPFKEDRPHSMATFVTTNLLMYGATVFHAMGRQAEVDACKREAGFANGVYLRGSYKGQAPATQTRFYSIALPIDAGVTMLSALARRKGWRAFEVAAPLSAASAHITAGAFKFSSGCY